MSESVAAELRAAIRASPGDRALRLVYADHLMERGDPRGEWIALSCGQATEDDAREMRRRALWQAYGAQWRIEDLGGHEPTPDQHVGYRDGFLNHAQLDVADVLALEPVLVRQPLRSLHVTATDGSFAALVGSPVLETVSSLDLDFGRARLDEDALIALLSAPQLGRLEHLSFESRGNPGEIWRAIERYPHLAELKDLGLWRIAMSPERARWLGHSLSGLTSLTMWDGLTAASLDGLCQTATFRLHELQIGHETPDNNDLVARDGALVRALESPLAHELTTLGAVISHQPNPVVAALSRLPCARSLQELDLGRRGDPEDVRALGDCELPALERLGIGSHRVTDDDLRVLARCPALTRLHADGNEITWRGAELIMRTLPRLEDLELSGNPLGDEGALAIASSESARSLRHLALNEITVPKYVTALRDSAISGMIDGDRLSELRALSLCYDALGEEAVRALVNGPFDRMEQLLVVDIDDGYDRASLFDARWVHWPEPSSGGACYQRKLELSGRAVEHR